jgi:hypothetical protein
MSRSVCSVRERERPDVRDEQRNQDRVADQAPLAQVAQALRPAHALRVERRRQRRRVPQAVDALLDLLPRAAVVVLLLQRRELRRNHVPLALRHELLDRGHPLEEALTTVTFLTSNFGSDDICRIFCSTCSETGWLCTSSRRVKKSVCARSVFAPPQSGL